MIGMAIYMKVDIEELQVRRARCRKSIKIMESKYGKQIGKDFGVSISSVIFDGTIIVIHNNKVIGMCGYGFTTIYGVAVIKEYRNNGVCHLLMKNCIETMKPILKKSGDDSIKLFADNPIAQNIYKSIGFVEVCAFGKEIHYDLKI